MTGDAFCPQDSVRVSKDSLGLSGLHLAVSDVSDEKFKSRKQRRAGDNSTVTRALSLPCFAVLVLLFGFHDCRASNL